MIELELTPRERELVVEVLQSSLSDLRMEIADTDRMEFREALKEQKEALRKLLFAVQTS